MHRPLPMKDTAASPREVRHLRNRVRLYLQVMLIIDILARVSDVVSPLFIEDLDYSEIGPAITLLRWVVTAVTAAGWLFTRFARPGRTTLVILETAITLGLAVVYVQLARSFATAEMSSYAPMFAVFGLILLLGVRAALVPSPVLRTTLIGVASFGFLFVVARDSVGALEPELIDGLTFMSGAFVLANAVTSHVIYGLRREVRQALQLGQYTLEEKLGEGGMGAVYRARHAMLRREAAIKLIKPEVSGEGTRRQQAQLRFEREAQVTANLKSPHTIQLYDFGVSAEGAFYYVMELLDGINLEVAVAKYGPLPPARVVYLLRQVCESLEEAHAAGLVHRDIKPANIFLCRQGIRDDFVKVLDFGLVALEDRPAPADPKLTADGIAAGTPAYLSPETVAGTDPVDGRADLYALGGVAYWLLTGHAPFERETPLATILAHVNDPPAPPSSLSETAIPEPLEALILECLAKNPADRPATAGELARRLNAALDTGAWSREQAARWWETHNPRREETPPSFHEEPAVKVTKAFD